MERIKDGETVILQRKTVDMFGTHGVLIYGGRYLCFTLEEPWRNNAPGNPNAETESRIPAGRYKCVPHSGQHFKDVWRLENVPGREGILIHAGNTLKDTEGCILVGLQNIKSGVAQAREAVRMLRDTLPLRSFWLDVRDPLYNGL